MTAMVAPAAPARRLKNADPLPPLSDPLLVAEWLSEITGTPLPEVQQRLAAECRLVGHNVREAARHFGLAPHVWNDRLLEFYGQTNAFLYETAAWNATRMKQELRESVCRVLTARLPEGARVLCFGDGMGFDSAAIASRGFEVTCYEVSGPCLEFAQRIFDLNESNCRIVTDESQFAEDAFDAVVCLDVLEHVPDPPAVVQKFARWCRPEGYLAAHAPFYHVDSSRPTHLRSNRRYAGSIRKLYGQAGFRIIHSGGALLNPVVFQNLGHESAAVVPFGLKLKLGVSQGLVCAARFLPFMPGAVASLVCKPQADWVRQLKAATAPGRSAPGTTRIADMAITAQRKPA